jgi:hypothetical protein
MKEGEMGGTCGMNGGGGAVYTELWGYLEGGERERRLCRLWRKLETRVEMCCVLGEIKEEGCFERGN